MREFRASADARVPFPQGKGTKGCRGPARIPCGAPAPGPPSDKYLVSVEPRRGAPDGVPSGSALTLVLLACPAGVVNQVFGANYLFLRAPAASGILFRFPALAGVAAVVLGVEALGVWGMEKAAHRRDSECCL